MNDKDSVMNEHEQYNELSMTIKFGSTVMIKL